MLLILKYRIVLFSFKLPEKAIKIEKMYTIIVIWITLITLQIVSIVFPNYNPFVSYIFLITYPKKVSDVLFYR